MLLEIKSRSKNIKDISTDEFTGISFTNDLIEMISKESGLNRNRIRVTFEKDGKKVPLKINTQLKAYNLGEKSVLTVKDLGPQIAWRTVFLVEYFGPILFHSLFFYGFRELYPGQYTLSFTQILLYDLSLIHFTKREYETLFVHKFSNSTMPLFNIFKNSFHYWILNGVLCGFFTYTPEFLHPDNKIGRFLFHVNDFSVPTSLVIGVLILLCEYANYLTHVNLSQIRDKDPKSYQIPYGFGFDLVTCPNYLFEILAFVGMTILSGNWSYFVFTMVAAVQMYIWAVGKHKRYLKTFGDKYKKLNRKLLIPYVL